MSPGPRPTSITTTKWHLDPSSRLATTDMGRKLGGCDPMGVAGSPSNTVFPGTRPTSLPSGILIHRAISPQRTRGRKLGTCAPFGEELGPRLTQCGRHYSPYQAASWSIQPFGHNRHGPKIGGGGCAPFGGSWVPIWYNVAGAEAYLRAKFHLDPSNC